MGTGFVGRGWPIFTFAIILLGAAFLWMNKFRYDKIEGVPIRTDRITGTVEILAAGEWRSVKPVPQQPPTPVPEPTPDPLAEWKRWALHQPDSDVPGEALAEIHANVVLDPYAGRCAAEIQNTGDWVLTEVSLSVGVHRLGHEVQPQIYKLSALVWPLSIVRVPLVIGLDRPEYSDHAYCWVVAARGKDPAASDEPPK